MNSHWTCKQCQCSWWLGSSCHHVISRHAIDCLNKTGVEWIKMHFYQFSISHHKDRTVSWLSSLYNIQSIYLEWDFDLKTSLMLLCLLRFSFNCMCCISIGNYITWIFSSKHSEAKTKWLNFSNAILKCMFLNENSWISLKISLKIVPKVRINNIPTLFQIMAWRRPGDKPLFEPVVVNLLRLICVSGPEWVKDTEG